MGDNTNKLSIQCHLAVCDDYQQVANINRNDELGLDYLPSMYFELMHNPKIVVSVAEIGDKVVCKLNTHHVVLLVKIKIICIFFIIFRLLKI